MSKSPRRYENLAAWGRGVPGVPDLLRRAGYVDIAADFAFQNQDLDVVHPDFIAASQLMQNTLLIELKSGANVDPDQARRASRVSDKDLVQRVQISPDAARTHDIVIVGQSEHIDRLRIGVDGAGHPFPILITDDAGISLAHNALKVGELQRGFVPTLEISWSRVPTGFVRIDVSSELWEVAEVLGPKLLSYMMERRPRIALTEVYPDLCEAWSCLGSPFQDQIRAKVKRVLKEAQAGPFKPYLKMDAGDILFIDNPLYFGTDRRSNAYRTLKTAQRNLIDQLRSGVGRPEQLSLQLV